MTRPDSRLPALAHATAGASAKILVTGFEPFGGERLNPSWEAVKRLPASIGRAQIITLRLPTSFSRSTELMRAAVLAESPDAIVSVGEAGGSASIRLERVAVNIDNARVPDNDGNKPIDRLIHEEGPAAYFSTLPLEAIRAHVREPGVNARYSYSAGTFVCNHVFDDTIHANRSTPIPCGFIHVPYSPEQVVDRDGVPSLSVSDTTRALVAALEAVLGSI